MARSPLYGVNPAPATPAGRDSASLGPSDTSDSGSDVANLDYLDDDDPAMPVDRGMREDNELAVTSHESVGPGIDSDASGTGERRSAGSDAGLREAADIEVDRIIEVDETLGDEADGGDLAAAIGGARADDDEDDEPDEDEEIEDEEADPVGDPKGPSNVEPEDEKPRKPGR